MSQQPFVRRLAREPDWLAGGALVFLTFAVYLRTLAPGVVEIFSDSLEFQLLPVRMAIAHPTGYPLFSLLLKLFSLLPVGDVAYRVNLGTALVGALAVAGVYAVARQLIASRLAALAAALLFAFGATFWSQSVLVEVYALNALLATLMLWLALEWKNKRDARLTIRLANRAFQFSYLELLAFSCGLALTHHRMSLLLFPALAVYILLYDRSFLRSPRALLRLAAAFVLPLLLYLYLPLRGLATSSLDGLYQNTPAGFISWVLASSYNVFLTDNPFNQQREAGYYIDLFAREFTWIGLALGALGFVAQTPRAWREWLLLALGLAANLVFGLTYHVADIDVFFIPSFLFVALFIAIGIDRLGRALSRLTAALPLRAYAQAPLLVMFALPLWLLANNFATMDLSNRRDVNDYGRELLTAGLPPNSTIVGILGEMTLVRYYQEAANLRPDIQTVAANEEPERLAAVDAAIQNKRIVFLTRPLPGVEKKYSLTSVGPLIYVQSKPNRALGPAPAHPLEENFDGVTLLGYDLDLSRFEDSPRWHLENGRRARVTLYWHVDRKLQDSRLVSLKLLGADGARAAQLDRHPVLDAYPTNAWRANEFIADTYDLPIFTGAAPGPYTLQVTMYDPESGDVFGQKDLQQVALARDTHDHGPAAFGGERPAHAGFGPVTLAAYGLETADPYAPGDRIPLEFTWRAAAAGPAAQLSLELRDGGGRAVQKQDVAVGGTDWVSGQYARQELGFELPASAKPGEYSLLLRPRDCATCTLPFSLGAFTLGQIRVAPAEQ